MLQLFQEEHQAFLGISTGRAPRSPKSTKTAPKLQLIPETPGRDSSRGHRRPGGGDFPLPGISLVQGVISGSDNWGQSQTGAIHAARQEQLPALERLNSTLELPYNSNSNN